MRKLNFKGFTLVELLIVIAIIALISTFIFVALNPLKRFQDSRDVKRWSDISEIMHAIKVSQVDNGGKYIDAIANLNYGDIYMISDSNITSGCQDGNTYCNAKVTASNSCVNLGALVSRGYLGKIPVSPNGDGSWSSSLTGYTLTASSSGAIVITACEAEDTLGGISVTR
jgi:prepilin-type N-terminal cleavage/methylation domain-containing protein